MPIKKTFFDKNNYSKIKFQKYIRNYFALFFGCHKMKRNDVPILYHSRVSNKCAYTIEILFCEE